MPTAAERWRRAGLLAEESSSRRIRNVGARWLGTKHWPSNFCEGESYLGVNQFVVEVFGGGRTLTVEAADPTIENNWLSDQLLVGPADSCCREERTRCAMQHFITRKEPESQTEGGREGLVSDEYPQHKRNSMCHQPTIA